MINCNIINKTKKLSLNLYMKVCIQVKARINQNLNVILSKKKKLIKKIY